LIIIAACPLASSIFKTLETKEQPPLSTRMKGESSTEGFSEAVILYLLHAL
jgi:hypothetical protein